MSWLFEPYLQDLYERRQWKEIAAFESFSTGARLVAALVLATARTGELVSRPRRRSWRSSTPSGASGWRRTCSGATCDAECRGKLVDVMLSSYGEARATTTRRSSGCCWPVARRGGPALAHLHARLLWCQVDGDDLAEFRDRRAGARPVRRRWANPQDADRAMLEDLVGLVALVPEPGDQPTRPAHARPGRRCWPPWRRRPSTLQRTFNARRAAAVRERANPPPMISKVNFCNCPA